MGKSFGLANVVAKSWEKWEQKLDCRLKKQVEHYPKCGVQDGVCRKGR